MTNIVQLQNDVYLALLSVSALKDVNIKQYRKMIMESETDLALVYTTTRNGRQGAGVMVEMPLIGVNNPNVEGPLFEIVLPILCIENPTNNLDPQEGTLVSAEDIAQNVLDALHLLQIDGVGQLRAAHNAITPANEYPDVVAYRANVSIMNPRGQSVRSGYCTISFDSGSCSIACASPESQIYYTTDGSFPSVFGNPNAVLYTGSFPADTRTTIRAASYSDNFNISAIRKSIAP